VRIDRLETESFRNLEPSAIELAPGVNLFVGENGQGKTNLLEAVYLFKFGRSFRTQRDAEMIAFGEPFCRLETACVYGDGHAEGFAISIERGGRKKVSAGGEELTRLSGLIGRFPVVLFGPDDLKIVSGVPGDRRRFLDVVGSMTDPAFVRMLREYRRVLNQRNAALKARASREEREAWNDELVDRGIDVVLRRLALTRKLAARLQEHGSGLDIPFEFSIRYRSALLERCGAPDDRYEPPEKTVLSSVFRSMLDDLEWEEQRRGTTLAGPHRDDLLLGIAGRDIRKYGSQGQRRLLAVLLKLSEMTILEAGSEETCVLLLDDVFSEFDDSITDRLQGLLESGRQVLVTSPVSLDWAASGDVGVFTVEEGTVLF
jgi:DNA replication and repair protein RecF